VPNIKTLAQEYETGHRTVETARIRHCLPSRPSFAPVVRYAENLQPEQEIGQI
jgi:hypothetical protein